MKKPAKVSCRVELEPREVFLVSGAAEKLLGVLTDGMLSKRLVIEHYEDRVRIEVIELSKKQDQEDG